MDLLKIKNFHIYQYALALHQPFPIKGEDLCSREGLIVELLSDDGKQGWGEISPLPGFSVETLADTLKQLFNFLPSLSDKKISQDFHSIRAIVAPFKGQPQLKSSLCFGVESAILNLVANTSRKNLAQVISKNNFSSIRLDGLLKEGPLEEIKINTKQLLEGGFRSLKLKVGTDFDSDVKNVLAIKEVLEGRAVLHLDANKRWDIKRAVKFGDAIGCAAVTYIEEPLDDIAAIPEFFAKTLIPVALDESLSNVPVQELKRLDGVDFFVVKPTILGGIIKSLEIIQEAQTIAIEPVISSSFETGIGLLTLANIAATLPSYTVAGLDTLKWFQEDLLKFPLKIDHGQIKIGAKMLNREDIRMELLKKIK